MKKYLMLTLCCLGMLVSVSAQNETASNNKVSDEDIQRYVDAKLEIKYREATIEALELTKDEILAFDPIFKKYLDAKERMTEKKIRKLAVTENGKIVGIITSTDLVTQLAK